MYNVRPRWMFQIKTSFHRLQNIGLEGGRWLVQVNRVSLQQSWSENLSLLTSTPAAPEGPWTTSHQAQELVDQLEWPWDIYPGLLSPSLGSARFAAYKSPSRSLRAAAPALVRTWRPRQICTTFQASVSMAVRASKQHQLEVPPPQLSATLSHWPPVALLMPRISQNIFKTDLSASACTPPHRNPH